MLRPTMGGKEENERGLSFTWGYAVLAGYTGGRLATDKSKDGPLKRSYALCGKVL